MPTGSVVKQSHDCTIRILDGAALVYEPSLFSGEVSISSINRKLREVAPYETRGKLTSLRHTGRTYPEFTLTIQLANVSGSVDVADATETASPLDVFGRRGTWAAATSTLPINKGGGDVFCVDIEINIEGTAFGEGSDHQIVASAVYGQVTMATGEPGTYEIACTVYGGLTGDISILEG